MLPVLLLPVIMLAVQQARFLAPAPRDMGVWLHRRFVPMAAGGPAGRGENTACGFESRPGT